MLQAEKATNEKTIQKLKEELQVAKRQICIQNEEIIAMEEAREAEKSRKVEPFKQDMEKAVNLFI